MSVRVILAAGLGLALLASTANAGPENVKWPADYKATFTNTFNGDRTANEKQVIRVFANDMAVRGASTDGKLPWPDGSAKSSSLEQ